MQHLENEVNWRGSPYVKALKGDGAGIFELRFTHNNVAYRPLMTKGPASGEFTLLIGAIERGGDFEPRMAVSTAQTRKSEVEKEPRRAVPHEYR